jgi:hypothetical protein
VVSHSYQFKSISDSCGLLIAAQQFLTEQTRLHDFSDRNREMRIYRILLRQITDAERATLAAKILHAPAVRLHQSEHDSDQRRLAAAVRSCYSDEISAIDNDIHVRKHSPAFALDRDVIKRYQWPGHIIL